ncbi:MAG: hypothetical protein R3301_07095 [Saprospiraceae bacterium]|nr:hypothetical protein [Saprospiraceae bacterium]
MSKPGAIKKSEKKRIKAELKRQKKAFKAGHRPPVPSTSRSRRIIRWAEGTRGILYLIAGFSLILAIILGQSGVVITLDDLIDNLLFANIGKVVLALIALALLVYGAKLLRLIK